MLNMYQQYMLQQQQQLMQKLWMLQTKTQHQVCIPSTGETYWACDNGVQQRRNVTLSRQVTPLMREDNCAVARATPHVTALSVKVDSCPQGICDKAPRG